jgi:HrpA-like RNA helicase
MHAGGASIPPASLGASALAKDSAALPAARHRRQLLWLVEHHATVIVIGDTGSGKTTQIPQFLYEAGALQMLLHRCHLRLTHPHAAGCAA